MAKWADCDAARHGSPEEYEDHPKKDTTVPFRILI